MLFRFGRDYHHDLEPYGIEDDAQARADARMAWREFGADFMAEWTPTATAEWPWAYREFGSPGGDHAR
jgi:hypothetical protein